MEKEATGVFSKETKETIENKFKNFKGIIYVTKDGELVYSQAVGSKSRANSALMIHLISISQIISMAKILQ